MPVVLLIADLTYVCNRSQVFMFVPGSDLKSWSSFPKTKANNSFEPSFYCSTLTRASSCSHICTEINVYVIWSHKFTLCPCRRIFCSNIYSWFLFSYISFIISSRVYLKGVIPTTSKSSSIMFQTVMSKVH